MDVEETMREKTKKVKPPDRPYCELCEGKICFGFKYYQLVLAQFTLKPSSITFTFSFVDHF